MRNTTTDRRHQTSASPLWQQLSVDRAITFAIGPEVKPTDAITRATKFARQTLPMLLADVPAASAAIADTLSVLTELVDITARHRRSIDILGRIVFDGAHITVSVGEMQGTLPAPADEPGLYLVRNVADDLGQHRGDEGGYVTWASMPVQMND